MKPFIEMEVAKEKGEGEQERGRMLSINHNLVDYVQDNQVIFPFTSLNRPRQSYLLPSDPV